MAFQCRAANCASWEQELPPRASEGDYRVPKVTNQVNRHDDPPTVASMKVQGPRRRVKESGLPKRSERTNC